MDSKQSGRRRFLRNGAALAGMALAPAGGVAGGEAFANANDVNVSDQNAIENVLYGRRSRFVTTTRVIEGTSHSDVPRPRPNPTRPSAKTPLGETMGMALADHVAALAAHAGPDVVDVVLANNRLLGGALRPPSEPVRLTWPPDLARPPKLVLDDVVDPFAAQRHEPRRLAAAIIRIHEREGSARRRAAVARTA